MFTSNDISHNIINSFNHIQIFEVEGKFGLINNESGIETKALYDSIEWDKLSDFIIVQFGDKTGFLSAETGQFIDITDEDPEDPYMMAIPYEQYVSEEWPEWMQK